MGSSKLANNILKGGNGGNGALIIFAPFIFGALALLVIIFLPILILYLIRFFKWLFSTKPKQYTDTITVKDKRLKGNYVSGYVYLIVGTNKNVYVVSKFDYERININDTFTAAIEDKNEDMLYVRKILNFTS